MRRDGGAERRVRAGRLRDRRRSRVLALASKLQLASPASVGHAAALRGGGELLLGCSPACGQVTAAAQARVIMRHDRQLLVRQEGGPGELSRRLTRLSVVRKQSPS